MNELSLFTGYAGFTLGLRLAGLEVRTVGYVEIDSYCQRLIQARIRDGYLDDAPIWPDIHAFDGTLARGVVDIVTAGFPCQPFSIAGKREGEADERNLWPETRRVIGEVEPGYVVLENVPAIVSSGYAGTIIGELSEMGYDCRWGVVSAQEVGAPHKRARWWCLAHFRRLGSRGLQPIRQPERSEASRAGSEGQDVAHSRRQHEHVQQWAQRLREPARGSGELGNTLKPRRSKTRLGHNLNSGQEPETRGRDVGNTNLARPQGWSEPVGEGADEWPAWPPGPTNSAAWNDLLVRWPQAQPAICNAHDGTSDRVAQLRAAGNGVVPAVVARALMELTA